MNLLREFISQSRMFIRNNYPIHWINPEKLFPVGSPYGITYEPNQYNDTTEIGMTNYLMVLPSIALYGFKYAIVVNPNFRVLNGDYRVFAARELNQKIPVVFHNNIEGYPRLIYSIIRRLRNIFQIQSFLFRRFKNPKFQYPREKIQLVCQFQKNILN